MAAGGSTAVRIGAWGALAAGAAFVVKVTHIFALDGAEHPVHGVLYVAGIVLGVVGASGVGAYYGRSVTTRIGFGVLAFVLFMLFLLTLSDGVGAVVDALFAGQAYVADEVPVALVGMAWLAVGYRLLVAGGATEPAGAARRRGR